MPDSSQPPASISAPHEQLLALARRLAEHYVRLTGVCAIVVVGSAARRQADYYSDLDFAVYYDALPPDDEPAQVRDALNAAEWRLLGEREPDSYAEAYVLDGVQCQIIHTTIQAWEHELAQVLDQYDSDPLRQKAVSGMLGAVALYGEAMVLRWQQRVQQYPPQLGRAMVEQHLSFFPLWGLAEYLQTRDATIWRMQIMVEAAHNLLGVLAGLNRVYYSTFQLKRTQQLTEQLRIAPPNLYRRIHRLFDPKLHVALTTLEQLVGETLELVEQHMPDVDTAAVRRRLGWRQKAWQPGDR